MKLSEQVKKLEDDFDYQYKYNYELVEKIKKRDVDKTGIWFIMCVSTWVLILVAFMSCWMEPQNLNTAASSLEEIKSGIKGYYSEFFVEREE